VNSACPVRREGEQSLSLPLSIKANISENVHRMNRNWSRRFSLHNTPTLKDLQTGCIRIVAYGIKVAR